MVDNTRELAAGCFWGSRYLWLFLFALGRKIATEIYKRRTQGPGSVLGGVF